MSVEEAFAAITKPGRGRRGHCNCCNKRTEVDDRVSIQVQARVPGTNGKLLIHRSSTFCASCGRRIFDSLANKIDEEEER